MTSSSQPLKGIRVLVGRARHQAGALSTELRKLGAQVLEIPFIEIRKPRSFHPLDAALKDLATYDWLILTSVNGVEAMFGRPAWKNGAWKSGTWKNGAQKSDASKNSLWKSGASAPRQAGREGRALAPAIRIAAIGPATKKAIEQRGLRVDVMPKEYVAESVVRGLRNKVKGKRVLLVRAKVARDVIPRELRKAGAKVDVVEAYETVVPKSSRARLRAALKDPDKRPHVVTFTSSSTVKNFAALLGLSPKHKPAQLDGARMASIGPVTSQTLRDYGFRPDIAAREFTIPGLIDAIVQKLSSAK